MPDKTNEAKAMDPHSLARASMAFYDAEAAGLSAVLIPGEVDERELLSLPNIEQSVQERRVDSLAADQTIQLDSLKLQ